MLQVIKVLLIEDNRLEARQTQHWLAATKDGEFQVECVDQLALGIERLARGGIDIILLDLNLPDSRGEPTFEKLHAAVPDLPIVVLTGEYDETIGPSTVAKGAQDYLVKQHADSAALIHMLRYALARHRALQARIKELQRNKTGRVIGFVGAKGGVGTTTTALNVAVALAMQGKSVILAELRPAFGTLALHLNQQPAKSIRTLLELPPERIGQHELNAVLCKGPAGSWVLFGPKEDEPEYLEIDPLRAEMIIKGLSLLAEFVILDLPAQPSAATRMAANLSDYAIVVTEREPGSVRAGRIVAKHLQASGSSGNLAGGVVRFGSIIVTRTIYAGYSMVSADIQSQLGCEVLGIVPWGASENLRALTEGIPLVLLLPDSDAAISSVDIAKRLAFDTVVGFGAS